jgi:hypothetical protein
MTADYATPNQGSPLSDLVFRLEYARDKYTADPSDTGRFAAKAALGACMIFIMQTVPGAPGLDLILPLRELSEGLYDLERNCVGRMLKPQKIGGGHCIPGSVEKFRAMAAALMEINRRSRGRMAAAEKVAQDLNKLGFCDDGGKAITGERVATWRDSVKQQRDGVGSGRFWDYIQKLKCVDENSAYQEVLMSLRVMPGSRNSE